MEIKQILQELIAKAYEVNTNTKHDVFVGFAGHVNSIEVCCYEDGWKEGKKACIDERIYLDHEDAIMKLQAVLEKLKELEEIKTVKGYQKIKDLISDIDEFRNEAELRETLQEILFICEDNLKNEPSTSDQTENR